MGGWGGWSAAAGQGDRSAADADKDTWNSNRYSFSNDDKLATVKTIPPTAKSMKRGMRAWQNATRNSDVAVLPPDRRHHPPSRLRKKGKASGAASEKGGPHDPQPPLPPGSELSLPSPISGGVGKLEQSCKRTVGTGLQCNEGREAGAGYGLVATVTFTGGWGVRGQIKKWA